MAAQAASNQNAVPPAVEIRSVTRRFGNVVALSSVSFNVVRGEFFSLLGPSGCGKTTLLRLIAGLDRPDEGSVRINGAEMAGVPANERPVNTVFQSYALFPHLTVWDNVSFGLRMKKVPKGELTTRVHRAMELASIADLAKRYPAQLSGGQRQRVALARAIVNEPAVLLLDEPLGALDLKLRKQLQNELHVLQRRLGITFIHVTHDQDEALTLSDRVAVMDHGVIAQMDRPASLYEKPRSRFVAQFLGSCNLVKGKVQSQTLVKTECGVLQVGSEVRLPDSGKDATLAFRPEKVLISLSARGGVNCFECLVEDLIYRGQETLLRLKVGDTQLDALVLNSSDAVNFRVGVRVECEINPASIIVLED